MDAEGEHWLEGLALAALDASERRALTDRLYGRWRPAADYAGGLFGWEERWFDADLPPAPARILLGGVGSGRELRYFEERGDEVVAFEPVGDLLDLARQSSRSPRTTLVAGGYEALIADRRDQLVGDWTRQGANVLGEAPSTIARAAARFAPFDAVVLGWGSFTHVVEPAVRLGLLRRAHELCPRGPLMTSFWMRPDEGDETRSRGFALGARLGGWIRRVRRRQTTEIESGDQFTAALGFGHRFSAREIEELARRSGYRIARPPRPGGGYPHMTLLPVED